MELHKIYQEKPDSCVKLEYKIDSDVDTKNAHFKDSELGIKQLIVENVKKNQDPYNVAKKRVNSFLKNDYVEFWKEKIRNSPTSASYATHKNDYEMEAYLTHVSIKKHRNALAKLRLSDHLLHIQTGRQTRPKTPQCLRFCKKCPEYIEDEVHFLIQCSEDSDIKTDLVRRIAMDFPKISDITDKNLLYKFIMKIQDPDILKSLRFGINLHFKIVK